jgi:hypothetical protein
MTPYTAPRPTVELQLAHLKLRNRSGNGRMHRGRLTWRWSAQPTPISRTYQARLECDENGHPEVFIDSPDIRLLAGGRKVPHLYSQERRRLCLYLPSSGQWNTGKLLANTLVPWVSLWLLYFEEWLWSDDWKGGGEHPADTDEADVDPDTKTSEEAP